jgi:hypothetical protein
MPKIHWREKLIAFAIHFLVTSLLAAAAAALIFFVWFPPPFATMLGGSELFVLVVGCDLALGPLISLVIYNSRKSRRELLTDYAVVATVQLAALIYGVYVVSSSRPAYVVFVVDRLEVIDAGSLDDADLKLAKDPYRTRPKWGPQWAAAIPPTDPKEANDVLFSGVSGKDISSMPRYYAPYDAAIDAIRRHTQPITVLESHHPDAKKTIEAALAGVKLPHADVAWLPIKYRKGFWTALIDPASGRPVGYVPLDPY